MATKKKPATPLIVQEVLDGLAAKGKDDVQDWTAQLHFEWEPLIAAIVTADAGLMIRASDQRRAVSVGLFVGASKVWATCRTEHELQQTLGDCREALETIVGGEWATMPTAKARRARKTPS